jgi:transposase InsO family protein
MVDHFTKWPEVFALKDKTSESIAKTIIRDFLARHSMPRRLLSDRENTLIQHSINQLWELLGIQRVKTSAYHPQTNTAAERFNRFLGDAIYASVNG